MLSTTLMMAAASVAAALITLARITGWKRILRHATLVDVSFTILLGILFYGTLTGMLVAILGGLFMALTLTVLRRLSTLGHHATTSVQFWKPSGSTYKTDPEYNSKGWVYNQAPYV